jgi:2-succinyl-5-enolpyruvyl-6-hydroxy-3-cyclohexene-1-carboxylate synthase
VLDERSAGFLALGTALESRIPAVVLCTSGSAAANLHPAVVEADEAGVPLIVLSADRPPELRGIGAGQTIDQLKLYGDAVRWFCEVGTHEADDPGLLHFRSVACRAHAAALGDPRPGPVHLNIPWREPLAPIQVEGQVTATDPLALEGRGERPLNAVARSSLHPEEPLLDELAERIGAAPRGLIVAGRQADAGLGEPAATLSEATGYPIVAEPTSQLRWGRHDLSRIVTAYEPIARAHPSGLEPELIIRLGDMPTCKPLRQWLESIKELRQVVIDPSSEWREPTRRAETMLRADPAGAAAGLASRLAARKPDASWMDSWRRADEAVRGAMAEELRRFGELSEPGVWPALAGQLADGDQVLAASSMPVRDMEAFLPPGRANVRFHANRGANGIDGLVSTATGIAAASGDRTWAVLGDLALVHDLGGLAAARGRENLRLVIVDNGGGGIFHFLPQAESMPEEEFETLLATPSPLDLVKAVELFGLTAEAPEDPAALDRALGGDARVVIVRTDRERNHAFHRRLTEAALAAVV